MTPGHLLAAPRGAPPGIDAERDAYAPICRNVNIAGRRTSVRMEPVMWVSLREICDREKLNVNQICTLVDRCRGESGLTAALRVFIISYFRELMRESGLPRRARPPLRRDQPPGDGTLLAAALAVFGPPADGPDG